MKLIKFCKSSCLDPGPGFFEGFFNIARWGTFSTIFDSYLSKKTDRVFMKILPEMYRTRISPLYFGNSLYPNALFALTSVSTYNTRPTGPLWWRAAFGGWVVGKTDLSH